MQRVTKESDILQIAIRKQIIMEIEGAENRRRKHKAYKRYQCYKDKTNRYVAEHLLKQFDFDTVLEMRYCLSNISIVRKIIDKLARVYSSGVDRTIEDNPDGTEKVANLSKYLNLTQNLKKTNRFLKLQKNLKFYLKPIPSDKESGKWCIIPEILQPYNFDVVEHQFDRTKSLCTILSDYTPQGDILINLDLGASAQSLQPGLTPQSDGKDQTIADKTIDNKQNPGVSAEASTFSKTYIWWSESYHFTTDDQGELIADGATGQKETGNTFEVNPLIDFALDQDNGYWAEGGDDLIDGAVLINSEITHLEHVGVIQGYGQFFMIGKNLPRNIKTGPTKAIIAEYNKDEDSKPEMGFLNANPQLDSLRGNIEMYLALLLTTNNLSTSGVAASLSGGKDFASGIALIVDKSESIEDVQDQRQVFIDTEPEIFETLNDMILALGDAADSDLKENVLPEDFEEDFNLKFNDSQMIMSEKEKLENMKMRKELGLDSMIDLLKRDDPSLDDSAAEKKLMKILEEKIKEQQVTRQAQVDAGLAPDPTVTDPNADPAAPPIEDPNAPPTKPVVKPKDKKPGSKKDNNLKQ